MTHRLLLATACALTALLPAHDARAQDNVLRGADPTAVAAAPLAGPAVALSPTSTPPPAPVEPATIAPEESSAEDRDIETSDESTAVPAIAPPDSAQKKSLEERLAALDAAGLNDDDKKLVGDFYRQALASFDAAAQQVEAALSFETQLRTTQEGKHSTAAYTQKLAAPLPPYADVSGESVEQVEERAARLDTSLAKYRNDLAAMNAEPKRRSQRMAELPKQMAEAQKKLKQAAEELANLGAEEAADVVGAARRAALVWSQEEFQATLVALDREHTLYQQTADWVTTRRDYFARYVPHKEKRLAQLREIISRLRESEAQEQARLAAAAADAVEASRPKRIIELANDNKQLADEAVAIAAAMAEVAQGIDAAKFTFDALDSQYKRAQERVAELSDAGGHFLRDQQAKLPNLRELERSYAKRQPLLAKVLLRSFELHDQSSELANLDECADQLAAQAGDLSAESRAEVRRLLAAKRDTLKALLKDYEQYNTDLNLLHTEEAALISLVGDYGGFIAERVLWIRSCEAPALGDLRHGARALAWTLDPHNWQAAGHSLVQAGGRKPVQFTMLVVAVVALALCQRPARRRLHECGREARRRDCTGLRPTLDALALTAVVTLPWPAILAFVGWSLDDLGATEFVRSLSVAIRFVAVCLLLLELTRHLCRRNGLADAHFDWPDKCLVHVRRRLRWLTLLGLPMTLWLVGLEAQSQQSYWSSSLGRALFLGVMLLLTAAFHRILLARDSPFRQIIIFRQGWLAPLRVLWRPAVVLLPASLAALAAVGYYYTAQQAAVRILQTVGMLLAVITLGGVTRRWLLVSRRRLAREQAKLRRAQLVAAADDDPASPLPGDLVDDGIDLAALSEQTQKLLRTFLAMTLTVGLVLIWGEILPALKYPAKQLLPGAEMLTWGHLAAFLIILTVTFVSVRDVPALLELVILQHLPLDSGARYAFTSLSRYVLTAIGLTAAFNAVEGSWDKIQWLVAAMSVGLGFGLQEIFANFVSGIILLFERPIRVGDVVTLGEKTGVVNRIRMRATTIIDPDRKEYIVPNKDLVTGRLLNWTLSDPTNRVEVIVSIASGSDTDLACELLLEAAREQPHVLPDPPPVAVFEGFTDTGLKLALRCVLPNLENRGSTIHSLHTAIDRKFRAAGIEGSYGDMRIRVTRDGAHGLRTHDRHVA